MSLHSTKVTICGEEYTIRSDVPPAVVTVITPALTPAGTVKVRICWVSGPDDARAQGDMEGSQGVHRGGNPMLRLLSE